MSEVVYVLTNPAMPGLVMIGRTDSEGSLVRSVDDLSGSVCAPVPFEIKYACTVEDSRKVERHIHNGINDHRINRKRGFFRIDPEQVIALLKLAEIREITPGKNVIEVKIRQEPRKSTTGRKQGFRFSDVGLTSDAVLTFANDHRIKAVVIDDRHIEYEGRKTSLSQAAIEALERTDGKKRNSIQGPRFWCYKGEPLSELRDRIEGGTKKS